MIIHGFEKFSLVDYDKKISCTVFTAGCNFRCPFCHNSSLVLGADGKDGIEEGIVFEYLTKRRGLVDAVCISGGEPTLQKGLEDFIKKVKDLNYLVKLDTNGLKPDVIERLIENKLVDYVAMDVKNCKQKYAFTAGIPFLDISAISQSVELLKSGRVESEFRTTLIHEFHTIDDMKKIAEWLSGAKRYYMQKYKDSEDCIEHGFHCVDEETALEYKKLFANRIGCVGLRGY